MISAILLALVSGTGRAFVGWVSDYFGRRQTLLVVCVILALSSFGVGWAGSMQNQALFITFAIISGFGGGAFYPLFAALTPDYFGENYNASNYGTVYSAKLVGAVAAGPIAAVLIDANGYPATYVLAGSSACWPRCSSCSCASPPRRWRSAGAGPRGIKDVGARPARPAPPTTPGGP